MLGTCRKAESLTWPRDSQGKSWSASAGRLWAGERRALGHACRVNLYEIRKGLWLFLRDRWGPPEAFERRSGGICSVFKHPSGCPVKTTCKGQSRSQDTSQEAPEFAESAEDPGDSAGGGLVRHKCGETESRQQVDITGALMASTDRLITLQDPG